MTLKSLFVQLLLLLLLFYHYYYLLLSLLLLEICTYNTPVDAYARLSAGCSIEGLERSAIKDLWCQHEI